MPLGGSWKAWDLRVQNKPLDRFRGQRKGMSMKRFVAAVWLALALTGCGQAEQRREFDVQYFDYFDTFTSFTAYAEDEEQFQKYARLFQSELEAYHQMFDIYHSYDGLNNLKTINDNAGITPVQADQEILDLLEISLEEYERTGGMVNVAMGSVLSVWHEYREHGLSDPDRAQVPDMGVLQKAAEHMDVRNIHIDREKSTVYLSDPSMRLDVGAVAKGYAARRICEKLRQDGVTSALISIGGNVQTIGAKENGKPWRVGIQNPDTSSANSYLYVIKLQDLALVTSGNYQRYYQVDGVRYHHIIDPKTLMPRQDLASVTILCPDGGRADALSTAVFNMPLKEGMEYVESLKDVEAFWICEDGREIFSSGFEEYAAD